MRNLKKRRGISILIEAVVVTILVIGAFSVAYYYTTPANPRLQRSQTDISQTAYNLLSSLARAHEFDQTIIDGEKIISYYSNCQRYSPNISASPVSIWSKPGSPATYVITLVNNDKFCGNELFSISVSLPSPFWNLTLSQSQVTVSSNGGTVEIQMSVVSPILLGNSGSFSIVITASNMAQSVPQSAASASTTVYYIVNSDTPCIYNNPSISVQPSSQTSAPNATVSYAVLVTNNDRNCGMENFQLAVRPLANWTASIAQSILQVGSQNNASTTLNETLTASSTLSKGVLVTVSNAANPYSQSSLIIGYTKGSSSTTCSKTYSNKPSLTGKPANTFVQPYGNVSTAIIIGISDKNGCAEGFNLSYSLTSGATGWKVSLSTTKVTLVEPPNIGNGPKGGFTLYVSAQPGASPSITVTITATSIQNPSLTNSLPLTFSLGSQPTCTRSNPSVAINPPNLWSANGSSYSYQLTVTNNNNNLCDSGVGIFKVKVNISSPSQLSILTNQTIKIADQNFVTLPVLVTSNVNASSGNYNFNITVTDNASSSINATANSNFYVVPQCLDVTYSCLQSIGALYPNWQHNLNVALASLIPKGYIYNLTVYLVYAPPDNPFNAKLIPLNGGLQITDANVQAFKNAANVASASYTYTIPSLLMLQFDLQLAEVTSP